MTAHRIHTAAVFAGRMSASMMVTMGLMMVLLTSDWFLTLVNRPHGNTTGAQEYYQYTPSVLIDIDPELMLVLGFVVIISALCGGFRRESVNARQDV